MASQKWGMIVTKPLPGAIDYVIDKGYQIEDATKLQAETFVCEASGDLYRRIAEAHQADNNVRLVMGRGTTIQDMRYAATGVWLLDNDLRWDGRRKQVGTYRGKTTGRLVRWAWICRPLGDDDLTLEAFEATLEPSTHTRASEHTQRAPDRRVSFPG